MTKKDYEAIAMAFQNSEPLETAIDMHEAWENCIEKVSAMMAADNSRFNPDRFRAACTFGANVKARTRYTIPAR